MTVVSLLLEEIPHYRVAFLERLHSRLHSAGVDLRVHFGRSPQMIERQLADAEWAERVSTVAGRILNLDYVWQSALGKVSGTDLVVVEQANRHLVNYCLHAHRALGRRKLAYWGHGRNMQSRAPGGFREKLKVTLLRHVDWWFAYTEATRDYLLSRSYPSECITVVNNSQDAERLKLGLDLCRTQGRRSVRASLGCGDGPVALYCGRLSDSKRIDFLLSAAERIRAVLPTFELLIVGDGPHRDAVRQAAERHAWIRYFGGVMDDRRARFWHAADVALMPGAVGLVIIDSFIAQCPLITTQNDLHGPEYTYLDHGRNGIATLDSLDDYASEVVSIVCNKARLSRLQAGCVEGAERYSLDRMTGNFADGVLTFLNSTSRERTGLAHS